MNKLLAVLLSSTVLAFSGQALAQGSTSGDPARPGSGMRPSPTTTNGDTATTNGKYMTKKKSAKQKRAQKKNGAPTRSLGKEVDPSVSERKDP